MENIFIILLGLTMLYISSTSRLLAHINMLAIQGALLFMICMAGICKESWFSFDMFNNIVANWEHILAIVLIVFETLIVKSILIPIFLKKVVNKTHAHRDTGANIPHFYALVISSIILFSGFMLANLDIPAFKSISPLFFGVSIAVIIISLWLITIKHTVLSNVISFITMENGIFLLRLSVAKEMPIIVNIGVLLDIFIAVFILGLLVKEIVSEFDDLEVSQLSELKDYE
jgi:hydrogenase-4 component E